MPVTLPATLSVVIPTHNTRDLTCRCLTALSASHRRPDECLVVDDGGSDDIAAVVEQQFPSVRMIRRPVGGGFSLAVNDGWRQARGDLVLLLNSDTEVTPSALDEMERAFRTDDRLGIAGASLVFMDGWPQWSAGALPNLRWLFAMRSGLGEAAARLPGYRRLRPESQRGGDVGWVPATAMMVRREVYERLGGFDPVYRTYAQDLDYCWRAARAGWRVSQVSGAVVRHVRGATIAGQADNRLDHDPVALDRDLTTWIRRAHPPRRAARMSAALVWGRRLRVADNRRGSPSLTGDGRAVHPDE